jgi:hypothetical protein
MEIIIIVFLLSVVATFIVLYLICPKPKLIMKYPNTDEKLSDLYVDDNNVCYRYKTKEVKCSN